MFKPNALLLASLSLLAATSALAGESTSTLTRAEVVAEYQRARVAGELLNPEFDASHGGAASSARPLTRAEVKAEYARAQQAGEVQHIDHFNFASSATGVSTLTRADVHKEYVRARNSGELAEARNDFGSPQFRRAVQ